MEKILFRMDNDCFICDFISFVVAWIFAIICCIITLDAKQFELLKEDLKGK